MALITLSNAQLAYGHVALLDHTDFSLEEGERVGIIGRNGAGKSSMLKILAGIETPDDGTLTIQQGVRIAYVPQEPVFAEGATTTESIPNPKAATVPSAMRLKVVFVDICFLSISQDQEFPELGFELIS